MGGLPLVGESFLNNSFIGTVTSLGEDEAFTLLLTVVGDSFFLFESKMS